MTRYDPQPKFTVLKSMPEISTYDLLVRRRSAFCRAFPFREVPSLNFSPSVAENVFNPTRREVERRSGVPRLFHGSKT